MRRRRQKDDKDIRGSRDFCQPVGAGKGGHPRDLLGGPAPSLHGESIRLQPVCRTLAQMTQPEKPDRSLSCCRQIMLHPEAISLQCSITRHVAVQVKRPGQHRLGHGLAQLGVDQTDDLHTRVRHLPQDTVDTGPQALHPFQLRQFSQGRRLRIGDDRNLNFFPLLSGNIGQETKIKIRCRGPHGLQPSGCLGIDQAVYEGHCGLHSWSLTVGLLRRGVLSCAAGAES